MLDNDTDPDDDTLLVDIIGNTPPSNGVLVVNEDGTLTYKPNPGFAGTDSFTYKACDSEGLCDEATVTVNVTAITPTLPDASEF